MSAGFSIDLHEFGDDKHTEIVVEWQHGFDLDSQGFVVDVDDAAPEQAGRASLAAAGTLARLAAYAAPWIDYSAQLHKCRRRLVLYTYGYAPPSPRALDDGCCISFISFKYARLGWTDPPQLWFAVPTRYKRIWAKQTAAWLSELLQADATRDVDSGTSLCDGLEWTVTPTKLWQEWSESERQGRVRAEQDRAKYAAQLEASRTDRAEPEPQAVSLPQASPVHGTQPAGNTPAPAYYQPDETEAEPDEAELARRREVAARGHALVTAALQRVDPDWDDLPIPIPTLPTDHEQATA
jgi:hypothetical protein